MSNRRLLRTNAILDGVTGVVSVPAVTAVSYRRPSTYWRRQSDVEKSWTFVGKYLDLAIQEYEMETRSAPRRKAARTEA